jgi:hypothetical protein
VRAYVRGGEESHAPMFPCVVRPGAEAVGAQGRASLQSLWQMRWLHVDAHDPREAARGQAGGAHPRTSHECAQVALFARL